MRANLLFIYWGAIVGCILQHITADNVIVITKRYSNNSYSCYVRHTRDGLEYHLTYNVCFVGPLPHNGTEQDEPVGFQCLYYECSITSSQLVRDDGQLVCSQFTYTPPSIYQPMYDRITAFRKGSISNGAFPKQQRMLSRAKRDFSWMNFLEKVSFMGRHHSTVSKQNEGYFHYNFMNKPGGSVGGHDSFRPATAAPTFAPSPEPLTTEITISNDA